MPQHSLISEYRGDSIQLGNHDLYDIIKMHGLDELPKGLNGKTLLTLELPSIRILAAEQEVGRREFFLCYSLDNAFLFIVETEMSKSLEQRYRAQFGANDNYDTITKVQRIVWFYTPDSARANDTLVAGHLKPYLPSPR